MVRCDHRRRGLLSPGEFHSTRRGDTSDPRPLSSFVLQAALEQSRRWQSLGCNVPVAVHLSVQDLNHPEFSNPITDLLNANGVSLGHLYSSLPYETSAPSPSAKSTLL